MSLIAAESRMECGLSAVHATFAAATAATRGPPISELAAADDPLRSAIATAEPPNSRTASPRLRIGLRQNQPMPVACADLVFSPGALRCWVRLFATATNNEAEAQSRTSHDFLSAAVTAAAPKSNAVLVIASLFDNREQPISRSDFVFEFWISL
jgi:hypothetical protein